MSYLKGYGIISASQGRSIITEKSDLDRVKALT